MYIEEVPNRNSPPTLLLRESWREGKKIRKRTLANLTRWPRPLVDALRRCLQGEQLVSIDEVFSVHRSLPHGHVAAVLGMIRRLGLDSLIASKRCRERDLGVALIAERLMHPCSKLATTRLWPTTTLAGELGIENAEVEEVYAALRWLLKRQKRIEAKLAKRHLSAGEPILYDVSSSYYEGRTCPLIAFGYSRDHRKDRPQIVYGVITDLRGCPVSVDVYAGNTGDPKTVPDQVEKLCKRFGLSRAVLVGDRGMLTQTRIETLKTYPGLGWISSLRSDAIRRLIQAGALQRSLFDRTHLAEITAPEFPGERLVVCFNPFLADERRRKREELLTATEQTLEKIVHQVKRRTNKPLRKEEIALRVGKGIGRHKMEKHFILKMEDGVLEYHRNEESIRREEELDGIYVVRTSESKRRLSAEDAVRTYKSLSGVERAFRTLKGVDLRIRPIHHRLEETVRAHVFLCLLAYYVEWHLRKAWAPLLFDDEQLEANRWRRDPVAPAQPSASAKRKKARRKTEEGLEVQSFQTLLKHLATQNKNWCQPREASSVEALTILTDPTPLQSRAFQLLELYPVPGN